MVGKYEGGLNARLSNFITSNITLCSRRNCNIYSISIDSKLFKWGGGVMYFVILDYSDDVFHDTYRYKFYTQEEAMDFIEDMKDSENHSNFDLVKVEENYD